MYILSLALVMAAPTVNEVLDRVQATYRNAGDIEAHFTQIYVDKLRGKRRQESGRLWAKQDGRVRWTYDKPVRKDFVFDGKTAYFYEPENAQVTVFERFEDSPLSNAVRFLWGQGDIRDTFEVKRCTESCEVGKSGDIVLELWPKKEIPTVHHSLLVVESGTYRVRRSIVFDALGNRTEYHFTDVHFGGKIADKRFAFVVPKGVSILRSSVGSQSKTH